MESPGRVKIGRLFAGFWLCTAIMLLFQVVPVSASDTRLRLKLGCVPFVAGNIEAMAFTEYLTTVLLNELDRVGVFEVAERKRLEAAMDLEGIRSDFLSQQLLQRLGVRLGVDFLVSGNVSSQAQGMLIEVTVLSVRNQRVILTEKQQIRESELNRSLQELGQRITKASNGATASPFGVVAAKPLAPAADFEAIGSTNAIHLRWNHPEPARVIGYMVLRGASPQGPFNSISTVTEPAYSDESLRLNETYYYQIVAVSQGGVSSAPTAVVRGATLVAPAVPIFMNVEAMLGGSLLTWHQRPCSGSDVRILPKGVRIYRRTATEKEFAPVTRVNDESQTFLDQGLVDGTTYFYSLAAFNQAGAESERSVQLSVAIPAVTSGLAAVSEKIRRVPLSWQAHPFVGVSGYRIQRATIKEGPYQEVTAINDRSQTSYVDAALGDKTSYWYRIVATSKEKGTGNPSGAVLATTRDVPPLPIHLTAGQKEPRRVSLVWQFNAVPDDEVKGFYLFRRGADQGKWIRIAELPPNRRTYQDADEPLKDATTYSYALASFNAGGGVSPLCAEVTATTKALPRPVEGLQLKDRAIRLITWQKSAQPDSKRYHIYKKSFLGWQKLTSVTETECRINETGKLELYLTVEDSDGLESEPSAVLTVG